MWIQPVVRPHRAMHLFASAAFLVFALCRASLCHAANPEFQNYFFAVCANPTGDLATRCAETNSGLGDLSGDSESSLNPSQTLSTGDAAVLAAQQRGQEIRERIRSRREADAGAESENPRAQIGPFSLLINARTANTESDRVVDVDAERGYELDATSAELGLDYRVNDALVLGAWAQWGNSELEFDSELPGNNFSPLKDAGELETDRLGVTAYLSAQMGESVYVDLSLGYTDLEVDTSRNSVFQESNRVVPQTNSLTRGKTDGHELLVTFTTGYQAALGSWNVTPFVGATYIDTKFDDYVETDLSAAGLALDVAVADQSVLLGQLGVTASRAISMQGWVLVPQVRVEYLAEIDRDRSEADVRFVNDGGANVFALRADKPDEDRFDIAAGLFGVLRNGWIPFVEFQLTTGNDDYDRYQISAGLRIEL